MKTLFKILIFVFFLAFLANASAKEGKIIGASNHEVPKWFKESFLDIAEDISEAKEANKHFMIFLDFEGCPYCSKMLKESFEEDNATSQFIKKHFDVIELNVKGSREVTWVDGETLAEKDLVGKLKIQFSPTVLFFNQEKEIIARINGYRNKLDFKSIVEFVQSKTYEKMDLNSYLNNLEKKALYSFKANSLFKDISDLSKVDTPLALIFEDTNCTQCEHFHNKILANKEVQEEFKKFTVVRFDANSQKEIILPNKEKTSPKELLAKLNLDYRPSVLLFDDKKHISTIDALLFPFHFKEVLRYVSNKEYIKYPKTYLDYLRVRQEELLKQGIDVNVGE